MLTMRVLEDSSQTACMHINMPKHRSVDQPHASVIDICSYSSKERNRVEAFIRHVYMKTYRADIAIHYPTLMSVQTENGEILAAVGFRCADESALFLEHYTPQPIELCLGEQYGHPVMRDEVAEIGNLASVGGGASVYLFAALASYLHTHGMRYAAITGTHHLKKRFCKLGLAPRILCPADPLLLPLDERQHWGYYYDHHPQVLCGSVEKSVRHLRRALGVIYEETNISQLVSRIHFKRNG